MCLQHLLVVITRVWAHTAERAACARARGPHRHTQSAQRLSQQPANLALEVQVKGQTGTNYRDGIQYAGITAAQQLNGGTKHLQIDRRWFVSGLKTFNK